MTHSPRPTGASSGPPRGLGRGLRDPFRKRAHQNGPDTPPRRLSGIRANADPTSPTALDRGSRPHTIRIYERQGVPALANCAHQATGEAACGWPPLWTAARSKRHTCLWALLPQPQPPTSAVASCVDKLTGKATGVTLSNEASPCCQGIETSQPSTARLRVMAPRPPQRPFGSASQRLPSAYRHHTRAP